MLVGPRLNFFLHVDRIDGDDYTFIISYLWEG